MGIRFSIFVFALLFSVPLVKGVSVWEGLIDKPIYYVNIEGYSLTGSPPWNPLNDSSITWINIGYEYNETHTFNKYYEGGKWKEGYFSKHGNPKPFNLSEWNLSKVLKEYQWGVENYLPNISGEHWEKGYWNSTITRWEVTLSASKFKVVLYGGHCGECEQYIIFECWREGNNTTCKWEKPAFKAYSNVPPIGKETTENTRKEENKICGPGLLIGLVLLPALLERRTNGKR
ncbi:CGP-CTERM sorting domain-containing protein [Thermococcus sp.]|uniref:CGP-CTERM sorting domain-containing protein n=1 Tax=Thermococcus sp. TaxID=35749 RepID=UPI00261E7918|nr:CGP-CTERM sorting domain-containing protein [Thermococcus sp.]